MEASAVDCFGSLLAAAVAVVLVVVVLYAARTCTDRPSSFSRALSLTPHILPAFLSPIPFSRIPRVLVVTILHVLHMLDTVVCMWFYHTCEPSSSSKLRTKPCALRNRQRPPRQHEEGSYINIRPCIITKCYYSIKRMVLP